MAWFLEVKHNGRDAYPLLHQAMQQPEVYDQDRVRFEMLRRLGYFAAMLDPLVAATLTLDQMWAMCDDLIEAHGSLLPPLR